MAQTGIARIDALISQDPAAQPIGSGDPDRAAVGLVQDLLIGFGNNNLPDVRRPEHGAYGRMTIKAVQQFRSDHDLAGAEVVDADCLTALARRTPLDPMASRGYIALALDSEPGGLTFLMTLTALWEANARFAGLNLNADRAGLSFGLIQWAQKPKRLHEIVLAFHHAGTDRFDSTFGGAEVAAGLLAHTGKPNGGVDPATGRTVDPAFDLVAEPWITRFKAAGRDPVLQRVQVEVAAADLQNALDAMRPHATAIRSQRGVGFLLDVSNQHGTAGALGIYDQVVTPALSESEVLRAMRDESVRRVALRFGENSNEARATATRRDWFLRAAVLSDDDFSESSARRHAST